MKPVWIAGFLAVVLALSAIPALAQPVISAKSGLISYVEGKVYLSDQIVEPSPTHFADVKENAVVRTAEGRAEVLLTPGVVLRLGENSSSRCSPTALSTPGSNCSQARLWWKPMRSLKTPT